MKAVTVSPKYQIVIPKEVRERMDIVPGQKLRVLSFDDRIELVRVRPMSESRGILKGLDASFQRDEDDRV
ncbi:MAG: AbrB/MazE/SpoVT family DNA-binding domain-containing protein [Candidatus Sumerlaeia bacterium]